MRILSLTTIYPNEQVVAEGRSVAFLDQALAKLGVCGTTLVLKPWAPRWLASRVEKWNHLAVRSGAEVHEDRRVVFSHYLHIPQRYKWDLCVHSMARRAINLIKRRRYSFDVIHGQCIYPTALAARIVSRYFAVPFVITLRDDLSHLTDMYHAYPRAKGLFEDMLRSVSAIFVHGPAIKRDMPNFLPPGADPPVVLAPNGADVDGINAILDSLSKPEEHSWGRIVSVGNLYLFKGIHENLWAMKQLDERGLTQWHYTIVGEGPYRQELEGLAVELGLGQRVVFTGRVPHREAIRLIRDSDIFCLPSWAEPFGNVYAESAICQRPAIGCRGYGAELTISHGETGLLVPPKDVDGLADTLATLLENPKRAREMGQVAKKRVQQFTWERTAKLYMETIQKVTGLD